jgi:hypothetical protein
MVASTPSQIYADLFRIVHDVKLFTPSDVEKLETTQLNWFKYVSSEEYPWLFGIYTAVLLNYELILRAATSGPPLKLLAEAQAQAPQCATLCRSLQQGRSG